LRNKSINIVFLALFHLAVLIVPVTIKDSHHHASTFDNPIGNTLSKAKKICPICQFEFVNFIPNKLTRISFFQPASPLKNSELVSSEFRLSFSSFSHRAPPVL
jgi:hypothetical protein